MTDMMSRNTENPRPLQTGEVLYLTREPEMRAMLSVLCATDTDTSREAAPCLLLCDGDDPEMMAAALRAPAGVPALFYTRTPADFMPPRDSIRYLVLARPFPFDLFRHAVGELLGETPAAPRPAAARTLRTEGCTAVSGDVRVSLTPREAAVLTALLEACPAAVPADRLGALFSRREGNSVSVYISYLRKKLAPLPAFGGILSKRGVGFSLILRRDSDE